MAEESAPNLERSLRFTSLNQSTREVTSQRRRRLQWRLRRQRRPVQIPGPLVFAQPFGQPCQRGEREQIIGRERPCALQRCVRSLEVSESFPDRTGQSMIGGLICCGSSLGDPPTQLVEPPGLEEVAEQALVRSTRPCAPTAGRVPALGILLELAIVRRARGACLGRVLSPLRGPTAGARGEEKQRGNRGGRRTNEQGETRFQCTASSGPRPPPNPVEDTGAARAVASVVPGMRRWWSYGACGEMRVKN